MGCGVGTQSIDLEGDGAVAKLCSRVSLLGQRTPRSALRRRRRAPKAFVRSFYSLPPHQPRPHTLPTTTVASPVVRFLTDIWLRACTRDARSARVRCAARVYSYARRLCMRRRGTGVRARCVHSKRVCERANEACLCASRRCRLLRLAPQRNRLRVGLSLIGHAYGYVVIDVIYKRR